MNGFQNADLKRAMRKLNSMAYTLIETTGEAYSDLRCCNPRYNGRAVYAKCLSEYEEAYALLHAACDKMKRIANYCRACPEEESNE